MKKFRLTGMGILLFFIAITTVQGQGVNTLTELEDTVNWEAILNSIEESFFESNDNPANELYKNLWECTNIRYPSTMFPQNGDTLVFTLVGSNDTPFCQPYKGKVISKFGPRSGRMHTGTDIKLQNGDSVYCAFDGKVRLAKAFSGYGNMVLVRHNNGLETIYGHLKKMSVKVNDTIRAGELIGLGGRTGRATTDHLHFETRIFGDPFDSNKYIDFDTFTLKSQFLYYKDKKIAIDLDGLKDNSKPVQPKNQLAVDNDSTKHIIRKGDNLWSIAKMYSTTVKNICAVNNITTKHVLRVGSILYVR